MIVSYIREHEAFIEYASDNGLSANERLVWYALIHIFNSRAQGKNWPDGFIRIANKRLLSYLPLQFDAMAKARNSLEQRGLIEYEHGKRNKEMPMYRIKFFSAEPPRDPDEETDDVENPVDNHAENSAYHACYPLKTDNIQGNNGCNTQGNSGGNVRGNVGDIIDRHRQDCDLYSTVPQSDRLTTTATTVARARGEAPHIVLSDRQKNYVDWFAEFCEDQRSIAAFRQIVAFGGYTYPQLTAVLTLTQGKTERGKLSVPLEYLKAVLIDWEKHEIRTKEDIESYMSVDLDPSYANSGYHCVQDYDLYSNAD